jgi:hypothetical protein
MNMPPGDGPFGFSKQEWRTLERLRTPKGIQRLLNSMTYHEADTAWSPRRVLHEETAHCLEGAILAAAALRAIGNPPLVFDLEAERDFDHVLAVYRQGGLWGAIGLSHFTGLRDRMPIYRTLRELALSYFDDYFNLLGERTLRGYSKPLNLARFDKLGWMTSPKPIWYVPEYLLDMPHVNLFPRRHLKHFYRVDALGVDAGLLGHRRPRKVHFIKN